MNIVIYNFSDVFGGQERYAQLLMESFIAKGNHVSFDGGPEALKKIANYSSCKNLKTIEILNGNSALYKKALKKKTSNFVVYVQHSNINDGQGPKWKITIRKCLIWLLLKRVDLVVRVCNNALPERYAPNKLVTIYNGVDLPPNLNKKAINDTLNLLMVGGINANKNQCMAIKALVDLPRARLTVLGDGPAKEELIALAKKLCVDHRIHWVGFVDDPYMYYQQADILLMLSHFEAFPYVVLEAMSYSLPVVSVQVGGVPEIIQHEYNGWLLNGYKTEDLVALLNQILKRRSTYSHVSEQAYKTIATRFTKEIMVDTLLAEIDRRMK